MPKSPSETILFKLKVKAEVPKAGKGKKPKRVSRRKIVTHYCELPPAIEDTENIENTEEDKGKGNNDKEKSLKRALVK